MPLLAVALGGVAAVVVAAGVQLAVSASTPVAQAPQPTPAAVMGTYNPANYDGSSLPADLQTAIKRDLHITPSQYLASAAAAADANAVTARLGGIGIPASNVWLNGTTLLVHVADPQQAEQVLQMGALPTAATPRAFTPQVTTAYEDLPNGTGWYLPINSSQIAICSTGFNGYNAANAKVVLTAGHCLLGNSPVPQAPVTATRYTQTASNQNGSVGAKIGTLDYNSFKFGSGFDSGVINDTNAQESPLAATTTWSGSTVAVRGLITATVGANICKSGRTTGWTCGSVTQVNYTQGISGGATVNSVTTTMCMYHGDSGGPAMIGNYAVGLNSSGSWSSTSCNNSGGFSAIYPLQGSAQSATSQIAGWEPAVAVDTPTVTSTMNGTFKGALPNGSTQNTVSVYVDGSATAAGTATVAQNGTWTTTLTNLSVGSHTYTVVGNWGRNSRSASAATGSFTVTSKTTVAPSTSAPTPSQTTPAPSASTPAPSKTTPVPSGTPSQTAAPANPPVPSIPYDPWAPDWT